MSPHLPPSADGRKPRTVLASWPELRPFTTDDLEHIGEVADILDSEPFGTWDDPRAESLLGQAEVVLGHWGCPRLSADVLARAPRLGLFAYAAGTVKSIVTDAVFDRGIRVTSGAAANAEPVAEYTLAAILFAGKDVLWQRDVLRDPAIRGRRTSGDVPVGNWGKTIGIVGASFVGRRVTELLRPFPHLQVALYDPLVSPDEARSMGVTWMALDDLCAASDVLSIHAPDLSSTRHLIGARQLAALRTGATVINTARGALVDHAALTAELEDGRLYAILDVTDPEPLGDDDPLRSLPNVFLTPHLAGSQGTELARLAAQVAEEIHRWTTGQPARNEVTRERLAYLA